MSPPHRRHDPRIREDTEMKIRARGGAVRTAVMASVLSLAMAACGSGGDSSGGGDEQVSDAEVNAALEKGGTLTVWGWEPTLEQVVKDFEAEYPKVDVKLVNAGTGTDQYTALQNAMSAGSGVPDVAQIEYFALSQFALGDSVTDLTAFGAGKLDGTFSPGPWSSVHSGDSIYGLPIDSGPMAMFYNKELFDKHDIDVPTTWDEYVDAARKLHKADPSAYMASDTGDPGSATSMIWQAGGKPFDVQGTKVSVDLADEGSQRFAQMWQPMLDENLVAPITGWTDEWYKALGDGTIATLVTGAWMPITLESAVQAGAGKWRVAPMPQWEPGGEATAENGGSSLAVPSASENQELAYGFLEYAAVGEGVQARIDGGAFPATVEDQQSQEFQTKRFEYFGGQQANKIFAESAADVVPGWSYLPYQVYADSIYNDTVGKAYVSGVTLQQGLSMWQQEIVTYGNEQGFEVSTD